MKRFFVAAFAAVLLFSCSEKRPEGPVADAISSELMKDVNEEYNFVFNELTLLDSTTFATEFARRTNVYEIQLDQNVVRLEKYTREGKRKNAEKVFAEYKRGQKILSELEDMREMMGAYYDYSFSGEARLSKGRRKIFERGYATVTPEGKVLTLASDRKDLHKATGRVIPGYNELLESLKDTQ